MRRVGPGVLKKLMVDRGFIDGPRIAYYKTVLGVDVLIPLKKNLELWTDAWKLSEQLPWQPQVPPTPPVAPPVKRPLVLEQREQKRQRTWTARRAHAPPPDPATRRVRRELCPIKGFQGAEVRVPLHGVVLRETYADGHPEGWALMTTEDFADPQQLPRDYARRPTIEERHRQFKCFYDLTDFPSRTFNAVAAQVVFVLLSYTLRQWQLWQSQQEERAGVSPARLQPQLNRREPSVVIDHRHAEAQWPVVSFTRAVLELSPAARRKARLQIPRLAKSLLTPRQHLRPP